MKVSVSELSACKRSLSVEIPPTMVDAEFTRALRGFAQRVSLDGFRKGKVPRHLLQQRYGKEIEQEVIEKLIREQSLAALKDRDLRPLATPVLKDYKYAKESGLTFTAEFEIRPEITVTGYKEIKVTRKEVNVGEIDVQTALDELRERRARFEGVEGRSLEAGDYVLADIQGTFEEGEGDPISQPEAFFEVGPTGPHPELADEIQGMNPGDERTFGVKYPKDHPAERLAGKRVVFKFTLKEVKTKRLPELSDEFAKDVGAETLEDLRKKVHADLVSAGEAREKGEARKQALDQLLSANPDVEVPETLVDDRVDATLEEIARSMAAQGMDPRQAKVDWDEIRKEQREPARRSVISAMLLDAIAKQESISIEEEELEKAIDHEAKHRRQTAKALRAAWENDGRIEALKRQLAREKSLDLVLAASNI